MRQSYEFALWIDVHDPERLFKGALAARLADEAEASFYPDDPEAFFGPEYRNKDGSVNVHACLVQLIDPGVSPDGCEILDSGVRALEPEDAGGSTITAAGEYETLACPATNLPPWETT